GLGQRLHDRGEIGSGIGEDVLHAALAEPRDIGLCRHSVLCVFLGHDLVHCLDAELGRVCHKTPPQGKLRPRAAALQDHARSWWEWPTVTTRNATTRSRITCSGRISYTSTTAMPITTTTISTSTSRSGSRTTRSGSRTTSRW